MSDDNIPDNEMDRLLQGAFESRPRGGGSSPSMVDVRHRARRHQRRRVGGVVGATAVLGVSGVSVLASRGTSETGIAGDEATTTWAMTEAGQICGYTQVVETTTVILEEATSTIPWLGGTTALSEPTTTPPLSPPTTLYPEGCTPSGQYRCLGNNGMDDQGYTYFEYCEPFGDLEGNSPVSTSYDVGIPMTTVTGPLMPQLSGLVVIVDASGLEGAAADMMAILDAAGVGPTQIIPAVNPFPDTMLIPITGDTSDAGIVRLITGIDGYDGWTPGFIDGPLPADTTVVVMVGANYWERQNFNDYVATTTIMPASTTPAPDPTTTVMPTTTP